MKILQFYTTTIKKQLVGFCLFEGTVLSHVCFCFLAFVFAFVFVLCCLVFCFLFLKVL